jgi:Tol biopolymer transport system component
LSLAQTLQQQSNSSKICSIMPENTMKKSRSIFLIVLFLSLLFSPFAPLRQPVLAQSPPTWQGQIAYRGVDGNLWVLRSDNPQPIQITADADDQVKYNLPLFSPRGDLLAYCRNENGWQSPSQLYLMRTGAWQPIRLVEDAYCGGYPQRAFDWSPDGELIAYTRTFEYSPQANGNQWSVFHGIWSVDITTGATAELVPPAGTNPLVYPLWSPDARWIRLYELVYLEGLGVLRTWNQESGALYNWLGVGDDIFPGLADWSPDSSRLVFDQVTYVGYPGAGLFTAAPDVTALQQVYGDAVMGVVQPLWSPDGANLAYTRRTYYNDEYTSLTLSSPEGLDVREVFQTPGNLVLQTWYPGGNQILFATDDSGQVGLYIYDLQAATYFPVVAESSWQADWAPLPETDVPAQGLQEVEIEGFQASGGSLLAYLGENYQLHIFDPANGSQGELSPPLSALTFWSSPSGAHLVYADRLLNLTFQPGGALVAQSMPLPSTPVGQPIHWAPDEARLSYRDAQGRVWLVDAGGEYIEIPGATSLADWSYDNRFISYCTEGDKLWVVGGGISLREAASPVDCDVHWSPSQPWLAYTLQGSAGPQSDQVYVYDAERGKSSLVMDGASLVGWSLDGELIALHRPAKGSTTQRTYYAVRAGNDDPVEIGPFGLSDPGLQGWAHTDQEYILGPYQLQKNLANTQRIASFVYDVSLDGQVRLAGDQSGAKQDVSCLDANGEVPATLVSINLSRLPAAERPGIWAQLSSDGSWASTLYYDPQGYVYQLTRCDRSRQATLESSSDSSGDSFSGDSRWYVQRVAGEGRSGRLLLYNLGNLERNSLAVLAGSPAVWVSPPPGVVADSYTLYGRVVGEDGEPQVAVNILVDDQPAATSGEQGEFELSGLPAGKVTISALKAGLVFSPPEQNISLPEDQGEIVFTARPEPASPATQEPVATPTAIPTATGSDQAGGVETTSPPGGGSLLPQVTGGDWSVYLWGLGILLVTLLFAALVWRLIRRRRPPTTPATGETALPVMVGAPTSKAASSSQVSRLLKQGVQQVKAGQNEQGMHTLRQVLQQEPDNALAWLWSGMAATKLGDWRAAERSFQQAKRLNHPKADEALQWLADQRAKRGG